MVLAILEVFLPAQILLGFAIGAVGVGLGLLIGVPGLAGSFPALILAWRGDPSHPLSTAERLAELLPNAELHVADSDDDIRAWPVRIREYLAAAIRKPGSRASRPRA